MEEFSIAQLVNGIDNTILFVILIVLVITAVLILITAKKARTAEEEHERMRRLTYQPLVKPIRITPSVPVPKQVRKQSPVTAPAPDEDLLDTCQTFQQSLRALVDKYSLDSFTIATSDGLVLASSGGSTAQEDAAIFSGKYPDKGAEGMVLFGLNHKGSDLRGIVRSQKIIRGEIQTCIERDTKDILNKWI